MALSQLAAEIGHNAPQEYIVKIPKNVLNTSWEDTP